MNFYSGNLIITRDALYNYGWKKDPSRIERVKWNSENKIVIIQDENEHEYKIQWDDIVKYIPINLPDVSKISYVTIIDDHIGIRFESNAEEEFIKGQPDGSIYVMYVLK